MFSNLFIFEVFLKGGPVMIPIAICSVIALAISLERIKFYKLLKSNTDQFMKQVKVALSARDYNEALKICRREKHPIGAVIAAGINHLDLPRDPLLDIMRQEALRQMKRMERNLGKLSTIASISPLLGLTGTITGMIAAFKVLSTVGIAEPAAMAGGISEALYTTATGLFVGIPTLIMYNWCESKISEFSLEVEQRSLELASFCAIQGGICEVSAA